MKAYDKIALLIAIALLGASVYLSQNISTTTTLVEVSPDGDVFDPGSLPDLNFESAGWSEPQPQSEDGLWLYRVFTPPIMYNNEGRLRVVPPIPPTPPPPPPPLPPFGVKLARVDSEPFRFRLESVFEGENAENMSAALLIFADRESSITQAPTFRMRPGETNTERQLRVDRLRREVEMDDGGGTERSYYADVTELRTGRTVSLRNNETVFLEQPTALLESTLGTGETVQVIAVGDTFTMNAGTESEGTYTVEALDLEVPLLILVKTAGYLEDPQKKQLRVGIDPDPASEAVPPESNDTTTTSPTSTPIGPSSLEDLFN